MPEPIDRSLSASPASYAGEVGKYFGIAKSRLELNGLEEIQIALRDARCVIVLWSAAARSSFWVKGEAAEAYDRDTYIPVQIDESAPPRLFQSKQVQSIYNWIRNNDTSELVQLETAIRLRIGPLRGYENLEQVADGEPVTDAHLHLSVRPRTN